MEAIETDVLVVGSGPAGTMLAYELSLAGVGVTVIDKLAERPDHSREVAIPVRAVELLEQRGLLGYAMERSSTKLPDAHFGQLPVLLNYDGWRARHSYALGVPHQALAETLEVRLAEKFGVRVRRSHDLTGLTQDADGVTATVRGPGGDLSVRAGYVVGCDGGRSAVRGLAEIAFPGTDGTVSSVVAEVRVGRAAEWLAGQWESMEQIFHQKKSDEGFAILLPQPGGLHRLAGSDYAKGLGDPNAPLTTEEVHELVRKSFAGEVEIAEINWAERMTDATRQAEQYRQGRVFLAGDAAHIQFPANGQGMYLGLLDAVNLGWKLAAEVRGWAPDGLLDSYHAEQQPVAARALDNLTVQVEVMWPNPEKEPLRRMFTEMLRLPEAGRYMAGAVSGLDIRYPMDGPEHALLGVRMVDVELDVNGATRWFSELLHGGQGALVTTDPRFAEAAHPWADRITVNEVAALPDLAADAVLVRPDGYVCWVAGADASDHDALDRLPTALSRWFGAPKQ